MEKIKNFLNYHWIHNKKQILIGYGIVLQCFLLDIASKFAMAEFLRSKPYKSFSIIPDFFSFTEVWNYGISFGMFQAGSTADLWMLRLAALGIIIFLWSLHWASKSKLESYGLALVIGGALGNIFDRFYHGAVYDFIDFSIKGWHFWTFNVADICITIGACLLILDSILGHKKKDI